MFSLNQKAKLKRISTNSELHGNERQPVYYYFFIAFVPSDALINFHPRLRTTLFKRNDSPDLAEQGIDDELTALQFPQITSYKFDYESDGYSLELVYGTGGPSNLKMDDIKIDTFKFTPKVGGIVEIDFRVVAHPDIKDVGKIGSLIMQDIDVILTPPEARNVHELFGEKAA